MEVIRRIVNLFITGGVLFLATRVFRNEVHFDSVWMLILITLLIWVVEIVIILLSMSVVIFGVVAESVGGCLLVLIGILAIPFAKILALYILDSIFDGFYMEGFWIKLLVSVLCSILCISRPRYEYE